MAKTFVSNRKSKKSKGEDRLSNLPDDLISKILFKLSTKDSVRTSLLSKRWRNLWLCVPALDLDFRHFRDDCLFLGFIDGFLEYNRVREIKRLKLMYDADEHCHSEFVSIMNDIIKRGVRHLTVVSKIDGEEDLVRMPLSLYSCASLVNLTLYCVVLDNPESALVSLPCVKTMHLEAIKYDGDSVIENLISSCSVIEELIIVTHPGDYLKVICVRSQSLQSFILESLREECEDPDVEVDTPRLERMRISDYRSESFAIRSISRSAKVTVDVLFDVEYDDPLERIMIRNFFAGLSTVREMIISAPTLEVHMIY